MIALLPVPLVIAYVIFGFVVAIAAVVIGVRIYDEHCAQYLEFEDTARSSFPVVGEVDLGGERGASSENGSIAASQPAPAVAHFTCPGDGDARRPAEVAP